MKSIDYRFRLKIACFKLHNYQANYCRLLLTQVTPGKNERPRYILVQGLILDDDYESKRDAAGLNNRFAQKYGKNLEKLTIGPF